MSSVFRRLSVAALLPVAATQLAGQVPTPAERPARFNTSVNSLLSSFHFRSIGPASMGGRLDDIEVSLSDPNIIYIGYAVGGVFKSIDNGVSFEPVFQTYGTASIGDIAVHPTNPDIVYVGTGEPNNRQTSSFGDGIYKSTDGGKTFTNIGLRETQTIARILIDSRDPEVVYVASPGHLFGPNPERGIFKSADGGRSWTKIKFVDDNTGFTDIAIDPANSNTLYATSYQRRRTSCCFNGGGPGSAVWKSEDAGRSWSKLTNGLPDKTFGRSAISVAASSPNIVYVQVEAGESGTELRGRAGGPTTEVTPVVAGTPGSAAAATAAGVSTGRGGGRAADPSTGYCNNGAPASARSGQPATPLPALDPHIGGLFRSDDSGRSWTLVSNCNSRPMYFSQLRVDPANPNTVYVAGLPVAKSLDGGKTFATLDAAGGNGEPGHVDQHAIWIDPRNSRHLMIGNDGGLDISYDQGKSWDFVATMATGLAYVVTADNAHPYNVYTGLQDNNSWGGPSSKRGRGGITNMDWFGICGGDGFYTAVNVEHPNIFYCESQDGNTIRSDINTGVTTSIRPSAGAASAPAAAAASLPCVDGHAAGLVRPGGPRAPAQKNVLNADSGEVYRFNWNTPFILSPHNPDIVYLGGNRLFKSYDRGTHWVESADLTKQVDRCRIPVMGVAGDRAQLSKNDGHSQYSTIVTVSESPVMPGVVWVRTDDGNLQLSKDGGLTFVDVGRNIHGLPSGALSASNPFWISRIDASHFNAGTAYVSIDGHRSDDLHPFIYVTRDYGRSFESISADLPAYGNVQVVREDPKNKNLLFAGTEFGLYASLDGGRHWDKFMNDYPTVRTDDIVIHPRDGDVIVATHGRSIWIADDITPLEQLTPTVLAQDVFLFTPRSPIAYMNDVTNNPYIGGQKNFVGQNAPRGTAITYYLKSPATQATLSIIDAQGRTLCTTDAPKASGIQRVEWALGAPKLAPATPAEGGGGAAPAGPPDTTCSAVPGGRGGGLGPAASTVVAPGAYTAKLTVNGQTFSQQIDVQEDRWFKGR